MMGLILIVLLIIVAVLIVLFLKQRNKLNSFAQSTLDNLETIVRDENFNRIEVPVVDEETDEPILNEDETPKTSPLFVNSHSYLLWLLKNNKVGFLQLLSFYLTELLQNEEFKSKLNKLT